METVTDALRARVADHRPALGDDASGETLAGAELAARVAGRARALVAAGVRPGDRVAVLLPNSLACAEALLAAALARAAAVPINLRWTAREVDHLLADAEPRLLVAAPERLAALGLEPPRPPLLSPGAQASGPALPAPAPEDTALILYTSGTTGRPKGAMLTHRNLVANARCIAQWLRFGPGERVLTVMPLFHANAIVIGLLAPLVAGGSAVIAERFHASAFWRTVERHRATTAGTVPTMLALLLAAPDSHPALGRTSLRFLLTGSAAVPADLVRAFEMRFGVPVVEGYGLTECTCRATFNPIERRRPGSCGLPLGPLRIVDADDRDVPPGEVGEIVLRGPHVMRGYFRNPEATAAALRGGWLHTGDLGRLDADGFVHVAGRASELIIRGGENVYPREIEEVLLAHPDVAEAAVVGAPDPLYGEVVDAYVVPRAGRPLDEARVSAWCAARLADFKRPARVTFVAGLPRGPTGKVLKGALGALASLTSGARSN